MSASLKVKEVAHRLGVCQKTVYRMIREGRIEVYRVFDDRRRPSYRCDEEKVDKCKKR